MFVFGVAVVLCVLASAHAQVMDIGACRNYQSSNSFTKKFIQKITESGEGYAVALSTESAIPCQQLRLFSNGTFVYSMGMADGNTRTFEGPFTAKTSSFNEAGYLDLDIPARVFGNGLLGNLRLYVLMTSDDYLVVAACWPLTVLRVENIYAMVPNSKFKINTATELNATLTKAGVPHTNRFHEVFQICNGTVPETVLAEYQLQDRTFENATIFYNLTSVSQLIQTDPQKKVCKRINLFLPYDQCRDLVMLADAISLILFRVPIPLCRPLYLPFFQTLCNHTTFRSSLEHDLSFIYDDTSVLSSFGIPPIHTLSLPATTYAHPSSVYNNFGGGGGGGGSSFSSNFGLPSIHGLPTTVFGQRYHYKNPSLGGFMFEQPIYANRMPVARSSEASGHIPYIAGYVPIVQKSPGNRFYV